MKKIFSIMAAVVLGTAGAHAQSMMAYDVNYATSPMQMFTDGTTIPIDDENTGENFTKLVISGDGTNNYQSIDDPTQGFPIGFRFSFDGKQMTQFMVGTDGLIYLGNAPFSLKNFSNAFLQLTGTNPDNFGLVNIGGNYGLSDTQLSYKNEMSGTDSVLVIQYANVGICDRWGDTAVAKANIQYRLYQNGNIEMKFSNFKPFDDASTSYVSMKIGIHGTGNDALFASSFTSGESTTRECMISYNKDSYPADGTTYTFVAPEPCTTPADQPGDLTLNATSQSVSGAFTPSTSASQYLVVITTDPALSVAPADKTTYAVGSTLGNGTVIANTEDSVFESNSDLKPNTQYYLHVFGFNAKCLNGPLYLTDLPLEGSITTLPGAPSLTASDADTTWIKLNSAADEGNNVMIAMTDVQAQDRWGNNLGTGIFGTPEGTLAVGDTISGGGKVVYVGPSSEFKADGLSADKTYYFRAWTLTGTGSYSSLYADLTSATAAKAPWSEDFSNVGNGSLPAGWSADENWYIASSRTTNYLQGRVDNADATKGTATAVTTKKIYLAPDANRITASVLIEEMGDWGFTSDYTFADGDTLAFQVSPDGKSYKTVYAVTSDNGAVLGKSTKYTTLRPTFYDYAGQAVYLRCYLRTHTNCAVQLSNLAIEQKPACDYPVDVTDSLVLADSAIVKWTPQGDESDWEVSYKKSDDETWGEPIHVQTPYATIRNLEGTTSYDVRVRALCDKTHSSKWSDSHSFKSGLVVPFNEVFGNETAMPAGWSSNVGELATPTVFTSTNTYDFYFSSGWGSPTLEYVPSYSDTIANAWLVSPSFEVKADSAIQLSLTIAPQYYTDDNIANCDQKVYLLLSHDGEHFNAADTVMVKTLADFPKQYDEGTWTTDTISNYSGNTRLGLYVYSRKGSPVGFDVISISAKYVKGRIQTGVQQLNIDTDKTKRVVARYNLAGQLLQHAERGVNIVKYADGTTRKVIVK